MIQLKKSNLKVIILLIKKIRSIIYRIRIINVRINIFNKLKKYNPSNKTKSKMTKPLLTKIKKIYKKKLLN